MEIIEIKKECAVLAEILRPIIKQFQERTGTLPEIKVFERTEQTNCGELKRRLDVFVNGII